MRCTGKVAGRGDKQEERLCGESEVKSCLVDAPWRRQQSGAREDSRKLRPVRKHAVVKCLQASSARVRWKQQRCCSPARLTDQIRADSAGEKRQRGSKEGGREEEKKGRKRWRALGRMEKVFLPMWRRWREMRSHF